MGRCIGTSMKRGHIWTVSGGSPYTTKPRPVLIVQDDAYESLESIVVCPLTTDTTDAMQFRPVLIPNDHNRLTRPSRAMIDKIGAVPKQYMGKAVGELDSKDMVRIDRAIIVFLGIAGAILGPIEEE